MSMVIISSDQVVKLSRFFSQLPLFSLDQQWLIEADVVAGIFFLPQLMRVSNNISPSRRENNNYKYVEYISFTWIATNRQNGYPLSNEILLEMMLIALLDYQLDEFMEAIFMKIES